MIPRMIPRMKSAEDYCRTQVRTQVSAQVGLKLGLRLSEQTGYKHEPITLEIFELVVVSAPISSAYTIRWSAHGKLCQ